MEEIVVYTPKEIAQKLKVHYATVYQWIRDGEVKGVKIGGSVRVTQAELDRLLQTDSLAR